jgi:glycosyltransferase involved in cell wall biosynthesis
MKMMKISIVTVCKNNINGLMLTIDSIQKQSASESIFQHIVVDGDSSDGTIDYLIEYKNKAPYGVDIIYSSINGVYSAINSGIEECKGDYVSILNSGDCYSHNSLNDIAKHLEYTNHKAILFGNMALTCRSRKKNIDLKLTSNSYRLLPCEMSIFHPAVIIPLDFYKKYGLYSERFPISADFQYLRKLYLLKVEFVYLNSTLVLMEYGGVSTQFSSIFSLAIEKNSIINAEKTVLYQYGFIVKHSIIMLIGILKNKIIFC